MAFSTFMRAALYHPAWGYYASGLARVGRDGDFFTSVSVGGVFGLLLARRIASWWDGVGRPSRWQLVEQGANDGQLMSDVLHGLPPAALAAVEIVLVEPLHVLRVNQQQTLAEWSGRIAWRDGLAPAQPPGMPVVFFCNELLDAFPVERVRVAGGSWQACRVLADGADRFRWGHGPIDPGWLDRLPDAAGLPDGYGTELRPDLDDWVASLAMAVPAGLALIIDYGFEAEDYFHPTRTDGTLRTYQHHRAVDDPFIGIGHSDITAHVNWSDLTGQLAAAGFTVAGPTDQGRWLTRAGRDWLLAREAAPEPAWPKWLRQFQTLTHPQFMGGKFQVVEARTS